MSGAARQEWAAGLVLSCVLRTHPNPLVLNNRHDSNPSQGWGCRGGCPWELRGRRLGVLSRGGAVEARAVGGQPALLQLLSDTPARLGGPGPRGCGHTWDPGHDHRGPRGALEPPRLPVSPQAPTRAAAPRPGPNACREQCLGVRDPVSGGGDRLRFGSRGLNLRGELVDRGPGSRTSQHSAVTGRGMGPPAGFPSFSGDSFTPGCRPRMRPLEAPSGDPAGRTASNALSLPAGVGGAATTHRLGDEGQLSDSGGPSLNGPSGRLVHVS